MRIALDVMGSDNGSSVFVDAITKYLSEFTDTEIFVFGNEEELRALKNHPNVTIIETKEVISMADGLLSLRRKTDASLNRMLDYLAANKVEGGLTAGSTAGLLTCSLLKIKLLKGIERPCYLGTIPGRHNSYFHLLDMGANSDCSPEHLEQFAILGKCYAQAVFHTENPRIALLNIGSEPNKGDKLHKEAFELLHKNKVLNFIGNIEGRDIFSGRADVVVTDGFSGNMTLKAMEGTAFFAFGELKDIVKSSLFSMLAGLLLKKRLYNMKENLDYSKHGGAVLIGFEQPIIKAHGSSNSYAIYNAMICLRDIISNDTLKAIKKEIL